jgi:hypothetical protein
MLARQRKLARLIAAKKTLKNRGWTYREAAPVLGVCFTHLCRVLTGERVSESLLRRISEIPVNPNA